MKLFHIKKRALDAWLELTIKKKIIFFTGAVFLAVLLSALFGFWVVQFSLEDFREILDDSVKTSDFMETIERESQTFQEYVKSHIDSAKQEMEKTCEETKRAVDHLPCDYYSMSIDRYAKTWSIRSSYEEYAKRRDAFLTMSEEDPGYIPELYAIYDMQDFLQNYARTLMRYALEDENEVYLQKVPAIRRIPVFILAMGGLLLWFIVSLAGLMYRTILYPIVELVEVSKKIADNDFFVDDVKVENKDEMGDLVRAFNKMKFATGEYILALEEKRNTLDLLHAEEMERLEVERRLESTRLELLKSQIDPHFLFNTLNVIGGMANLEDAATTEKMIKALSALFRYNLNTPEAEVPLSREIRVVKDYMYIQQMRFGSRISYRIDCPADLKEAMVPTYCFQPLVENAIIHGLARKEEGGCITIRVWRKKADLMITVADTGAGMTREELEKLCRRFEGENTGRIGIGLGNIYKRVRGMYPDGNVEIFSKKGAGTVIRLKIPQSKWREET